MTALKTGVYTCRLGENCTDLATVQIKDREGSHTRGCFTHAYEALKAIAGARVVWSKTKVANEYARTALEMTESRVGNQEEQ